MIIRVQHKRQYTVIANASLRDERLSFRATGILAYVLSLPDGTEISGTRLAAVKSEGRDAVFTALKELEEARYLKRDKRQDETGRWYTVCTISELPPGNPQPITGFQESVNQESVFQELKTEVLKASTRDASLEIRLPPELSDEAKAHGLAEIRKLRQRDEETG